MSRSPAGAAARALVSLRLDGPALACSARILHRAPRSRAAAALGWHLGQAATRPLRVARLTSGSRMVVDVRDYAHRHVLLYGTYESHITRLMQRLARPGWTVVDVGANAGYHSLLAADLGGEGSQIVAFEPGARMRELLRRSLALNADRSVELVAAACWDEDAMVSFSVSDDPRNTGLSSTSAQFADAGGAAVPGVRLDRWCAERALRPELVKIDVEGAELHVLRGAEGLLRGAPPAHIVCELWPASRAAAVELMSAHGYRAHGIASDGSLTASPEDSQAWVDVCFRHRSCADPPGIMQT